MYRVQLYEGDLSCDEALDGEAWISEVYMYSLYTPLFRLHFTLYQQQQDGVTAI